MALMYQMAAPNPKPTKINPAPSTRGAKNPEWKPEANRQRPTTPTAPKTNTAAIGGSPIAWLISEMLWTTAHPNSTPRIAPRIPITTPYCTKIMAIPGRVAPKARNTPISRVFSVTIAWKMASTNPAHTKYTKLKSVRISSRSFSTGCKNEAWFSRHVWTRKIIGLITCPSRSAHSRYATSTISRTCASGSPFPRTKILLERAGNTLPVGRPSSSTSSATVMLVMRRASASGTKTRSLSIKIKPHENSLTGAKAILTGSGVVFRVSGGIVVNTTGS